MALSTRTDPTIERARAKLLGWRADPVLFVRQALGAEPDEWQRGFLVDAAGNDRIAVRSGHGVGKSTGLAWLILWFMNTRFPCKVPITGSNFDQLKATLWSEVRSWLDRMPEQLRAEWDMTTEALRMKSAPEEAFAVLRTASKDKAQNLAGFHSRNVLVVVDEASAVDDLIFEVLRGALTTDGAKMLMTGNPTQRSGTFFRAFHEQREFYTTRHVSCLDSSRVSRAWIEEQKSLYGEDSNVYRTRVLGEFPSQDLDGVIPLDLIESAMARDVQALDVEPTWGVDVARYGDDRTALAKRQGNVLMEPVKWWAGRDTEQVAGLIHREYLETPPPLRPGRVNIDAIGIGAGVYDKLKRERTPDRQGFPVASVNVAESPAQAIKFERLRDELWWKAREWFMARDCRMADDQALAAELSGPRYEERPNGRLKVESKDDMKARGLRSPDLADAFVLTFAGAVAMARDDVRTRRVWSQPAIGYDILRA